MGEGEEVDPPTPVFGLRRFQWHVGLDGLEVADEGSELAERVGSGVPLTIADLVLCLINLDLMGSHRRNLFVDFLQDVGSELGIEAAENWFLTWHPSSRGGSGRGSFLQEREVHRN